MQLLILVKCFISEFIKERTPEISSKANEIRQIPFAVHACTFLSDLDRANLEYIVFIVIVVMFVFSLLRQISFFLTI